MSFNAFPFDLQILTLLVLLNYLRKWSIVLLLVVLRCMHDLIVPIEHLVISIPIFIRSWTNTEQVLRASFKPYSCSTSSRTRAPWQLRINQRTTSISSFLLPNIQIHIGSSNFVDYLTIIILLNTCLTFPSIILLHEPSNICTWV